MKSLYHENTHPSGALLLWYPPLPAAQGTGKKCAQLPYHTLQGSMMMRTRGNLYFKDVISPNEKIISALTWQLLVASIIHIHCLYPLQLRKLSCGNIWNTMAVSAHGLTAARVTSEQWPPQPSDPQSPALRLDYSEAQDTETMNLLTWTNSTALFLLLLFHTSGSAALTFSVTCNARMTVLCISFFPALKAR